MEHAENSAKKKKIIAAVIAAAVLIVTNLITGLAVYFLAPLPHVTQKPLTAEEIFAGNAPSVCEISAAGATGTGFIARIRPDANGKRTLFIATNYHVTQDYIRSGGSVKIEFYGDAADVYTDGEVAVSGYDAYTDVAVLKITDKFSQKARKELLTDVNDRPKAGADIVLLGNMSGEGIAVFKGAVTNPVASVDYGAPLIPELRYKPMTGVTADVNGGCSGGPVFDMNGYFIGIGAGQKAESGRPVVGVGYAVPVLAARPLIERAALADLGGEVNKVNAYLTGADSVEFDGLGFSARVTEHGWVVERARDGLPAAAQGDWLSAGDTLTGIAGADAKNLSAAEAVCVLLRFANEGAIETVPASFMPYYTGNDLKITFTRDGQGKTVTYTNQKEMRFGG